MCTDGRTLRHNQIFWDGWFTKFSYPWCSAARALCARGSSAKKVNHIKIEVKLANGDWVGYGRYFIYDSYSVPRYTIGIIYEVPTLDTLVP